MKKITFLCSLLLAAILFSKQSATAGSVTIHGPETIDWNKEYVYSATSDGVIRWSSSRYHWSLYMGGNLINSYGERNSKVNVKFTDPSRIGGTMTLQTYLSNTGVFGNGEVWATKQLYIVYPGNDLPVITSTFDPATARCDVFSTYKFSIEKKESWMSFEWNVPAGWQILSTSQEIIAGKTYSFITAKPSYLINGVYPAGNIIANVLKPGGSAIGSRAFGVNIAGPTVITPLASPLNICANVSQTLTPVVTGGVAPHTYGWYLDNVKVSSNLAYGVKLIGARPEATYTFRATDSRGCATNANVTLINNSNFPWTVGPLYMPGVDPKPSLMSPDEFPISDVVIASGGAPYYVGNDKNIYGYKWNGTASKWENPAITTLQNANGKLGIPEGSTTLYFNAGANNEVFKINVSLANQVPVSIGISGVKHFTPDYFGNLYAASDNEIWRINTDGTVTPIKSGLSNIMRIATTQNKIFIAYFNGTLESFLVSDPNTITVITSANPIATLDNGWPTYNSSLEADWAGNLFFADKTGQIRIVKAGTTYSTVALTLPADKIAFGNIHVNKTTGTVYYGARNGYLYQLAKDRTFYILKEFGYFGTYWAEYGDMAFASPNLFFVEGSGQYRLRAASYPTNAPCGPAATRTSDESAQDQTNANAYSNAQTAQITIAPNPASGPATLIVNLNNEAQDATVTVYDMEGQIAATWLQNTTMTGGRNEININTTTLNKGLYLVRVTSKDQNLGSAKLIVE